MALASATFIGDTVKFVRNFIDNNVTDPISAKREARQRFTMTSYPQRTTKYPIVTVKAENISQEKSLGQQTEQVWMRVPVEVRVWARDVKERDELSQEVYTALRENQYGTGSSTEFG